jgi:putative peptidoglycan lipid II flippase
MAKTLSSAQIARSALVVVFGFLASGVLGLARTAIFSITFGAGAELDAFYAAQRIPELIFTLVAGGALGSSFIPVFARLMAHDETKAWRLASAALTCVGGIGAVLALVIALIAPTLVSNLLLPNQTPEQHALTTALTRIMLFTVAIFSVSGLLMGILNAQGVFTYSALAASVYNIGQIGGALILVPLIRASDPANAVYGLAYGVVIGALLHLLVQIPGLVRTQMFSRLRIVPDMRAEGVREVLALMLPRVLGLGVVQINFLVNVALTSSMVQGSLSALTLAWTLLFFVLGVIAQSIGTALFPTLSALAANRDLAGYKRRLWQAVRGVLALSFAAMLLMIALGYPGIRLVFGYGAFTDENAAAAAWALSFYALGLSGHALLEVLSRAFYALSDTWTPVLIGVVAIAANITLSVILARVVGDPNDLARGAFGGLALANSITTLVEAGVLGLILLRRLRRI